MLREKPIGNFTGYFVQFAKCTFQSEQSQKCTVLLYGTRFCIQHLNRASPATNIVQHFCIKRVKLLVSYAFNDRKKTWNVSKLWEGGERKSCDLKKFRMLEARGSDIFFVSANHYQLNKVTTRLNTQAHSGRRFLPLYKLWDLEKFRSPPPSLYWKT